MHRPSLLALVALLVVLSSLVVLPQPASAHLGSTHFLVADDAGCTSTAIGTDAGCWSHTSGGAGGAGVPGGTSAVVVDDSSGVATAFVEQDIAMTILSLTITANDGTPNEWRLDGNDLIVNSFVTGPGSVFELDVSNPVPGRLFIFGGLTCSSMTISNTAGSIFFDVNFGSISCPLFTLPTINVDVITTTQLTALTTTDLVIGQAAQGGSWNTDGFDLTVLDGSISIFGDANAPTLAAGTGTVSFGLDYFNSPAVFGGTDGATIMDGITVDSFTWTINNPVANKLIEISEWNEDTRGATTLIRWVWTVDPLGVSPAVTSLDLTFEEMATNTEYQLVRRANIPFVSPFVPIATATSDGAGSLTFANVAPGDWDGDADEMRVRIPPVVGGCTGSGCTPPIEPVETQQIQTTPLTIQCDSIQFTDTRSEASNAILYVWNFGDGTTGKTTTGSVTHTYAPGKYTAQVAIQDRSGGILNFFFTVETGLSCSIGQFISSYLLPGLGVLLLVAIAGLTLFSKFVPPRVKVWLKRIFVFGGFAFVLLLMFDLQWFGR